MIVFTYTVPVMVTSTLIYLLNKFYYNLIMAGTANLENETWLFILIKLT